MRKALAEHARVEEVHKPKGPTLISTALHASRPRTLPREDALGPIKSQLSPFINQSRACAKVMPIVQKSTEEVLLSHGYLPLEGRRLNA